MFPPSSHDSEGRREVWGRGLGDGACLEKAFDSIPTTAEQDRQEEELTEG